MKPLQSNNQLFKTVTIFIEHRVRTLNEKEQSLFLDDENMVAVLVQAEGHGIGIYLEST